MASLGRDSILACYYAAFVAANWYALRSGDPGDCATAFLMLGLISVFVASTLQRDRPEGLKFGRHVFRLFVLLMAAVVAVDLLTIGWPGRAPWIPRGHY